MSKQLLLARALATTLAVAAEPIENESKESDEQPEFDKHKRQGQRQEQQQQDHEVGDVTMHQYDVVQEEEKDESNDGGSSLSSSGDDADPTTTAGTRNNTAASSCCYQDFLQTPLTKVKVIICVPSNKRRGPRGGVTVPFPERLHSMLEEETRRSLEKGDQGDMRKITSSTCSSTERSSDADVDADLGAEGVICSWQVHGRCFFIHQPEKFVSLVLPRYFKQTKLPSFQRQLNLYGFVRLSSGRDRGGYYHELFLRGRPNLCKLMLRTGKTTTTTSTKKTVHSSIHGTTSSSSSDSSSVSSSLQASTWSPKSPLSSRSQPDLWSYPFADTIISAGRSISVGDSSAFDTTTGPVQQGDSRPERQGAQQIKENNRKTPVVVPQTTTSSASCQEAMEEEPKIQIQASASAQVMTEEPKIQIQAAPARSHQSFEPEKQCSDPQVVVVQHNQAATSSLVYKEASKNPPLRSIPQQPTLQYYFDQYQPYHHQQQVQQQQQQPLAHNFEGQLRGKLAEQAATSQQMPQQMGEADCLQIIKLWLDAMHTQS